MMQKYLLSKLRAAGADDIVISVIQEDSSQLKFANNRICSSKTWRADLVNIFAAFGKRLISTTLRQLTKPAVDRAVRSLAAFARATQPNEEYAGIAQGPFKYSAVAQGNDPALARLGEQAIDLVESAINQALSSGAVRCSGLLETSLKSVNLLSSAGVESSDKGTAAYFSLRAFKTKDASGHAVSCSRLLAKLDCNQAAKSAAEIACAAKDPRPGKSGNYDVLFDPLPFANLTQQLGLAASAFHVEAGLSCLAGKLGKAVASDKVTLLDDGRLPNGLASAAFDDEGRPTQRNVLIRHGMLRTYLHNTSTARRYKTRSTANAGLIAPVPHNLVLQPGKASKQDLLEQLDNGLHITNTWYTRFQNYATGDFSTIPRDGSFLIKNGEVVQSLKGIRISDNLLRIMSAVQDLGRACQQVHGWEVETPCLLPAVLVRGVRISVPR